MKKLLTGFFLLAISTSILGQSSYEIDNESSTMSVLGTSTLHDWESEVEDFSGQVTLTLESARLRDLSDLKVDIVVRSIKSGKSGMDKNTYKALEENDFPTISYQLLSVEGITDRDVQVAGELTIAGTTKTKELISQYVVDGGAVSFNGAITFNMTEFDIDPPTALMGTIKTGDEVTIEYDVIFKTN